MNKIFTDADAAFVYANKLRDSGVKNVTITPGKPGELVVSDGK